MHSLNEQQHAKAFGIDNALSKVLKNISFLPFTFPNQVKINFMGLNNENIPSQLVPMSELSGKYNIPISFLTVLNSKNKADGKLLSDKVMEYLNNELGTPDVEIKPGKFGVRYLNKYSNGATWEFDDFRKDEYREEALNNEYCQNCEKVNKCVEGPYALRVFDTGTIKPCIIRNDNTLPLTNNGYLFGKGFER